MKLLRWLLIATVFLTACSGANVLESVGPASEPTTPAVPADAKETNTRATPPAPDNDSSETAVTSADPTPAPEPTARPSADTGAEATVVADDWCRGPAERMRLAFADIIWADRPEGKPLEQVLTELLQTLREVQPSAPADLEQTVADAIESQIEVNAAVAAANWDLSAIDWSTVDAIELNEESTVAIDHYGAAACGLELGFMLPGSESSSSDPDGDGSRFDNESERAVQTLVDELVTGHDLARHEALCLVEVFADAGSRPSEDVRDQIDACGVSSAKLAEIADG